MIPYVLKEELIPKWAPLVLSNARRFMTVLPEPSECELWSCHALVRAYQRWIPDKNWIVQDGYFSRHGSCHSWLYHPVGMILDLYPIAAVGSFLVEVPHSPWNILYIESSRTYSTSVREQWDVDAAHALKLLNGVTYI